MTYMIKFIPFIEYKMDKCYLTEVECVGLLVRLMANWDDDRSCEVLSAIYDGVWTHDFNNAQNQTEYEFGGNEHNFYYDYTAVFKFTPDREHVMVELSDDYGKVIYSHIFNDDEEMGFVDFLTYRDPQEFLGYTTDDDWDMK